MPGLPSGFLELGGEPYLSGLRRLLDTSCMSFLKEICRELKVDCTFASVLLDLASGCLRHLLVDRPRGPDSSSLVHPTC